MCNVGMYKMRCDFQDKFVLHVWDVYRYWCYRVSNIFLQKTPLFASHKDQPWLFCNIKLLGIVQALLRSWGIWGGLTVCEVPNCISLSVNVLLLLLVMKWLNIENKASSRCVDFCFFLLLKMLSKCYSWLVSDLRNMGDLAKEMSLRCVSGSSTHVWV